MEKYKVTWGVELVYSIEVDAVDEDDAVEKTKDEFKDTPFDCMKAVGSDVGADRYVVGVYKCKDLELKK